jgi:hypothetical protein
MGGGRRCEGTGPLGGEALGAGAQTPCHPKQDRDGFSECPRPQLLGDRDRGLLHARGPGARARRGNRARPLPRDAGRLTNAAKRSKARKVTTMLCFARDAVRLVVADDGQGSAADESNGAASTRSFGPQERGPGSGRYDHLGRPPGGLSLAVELPRPSLGGRPEPWAPEVPRAASPKGRPSWSRSWAAGPLTPR